MKGKLPNDLIPFDGSHVPNCCTIHEAAWSIISLSYTFLGAFLCSDL